MKMETYEIEILEPRAKKLLDELVNLDLIKLQKIDNSEKRARKFGSMKNLVINIADGFNAPLEDFKEYM